MAGHSKWANIKHKKGKADAARGKAFSKLAKDIVAAARSGGNQADNIALRALIQKAKAANMPSDNINRAVKKGAGKLGEGHLEEASYEGYVGGGIAVVVRILTDNRNRAAAEVRHVFGKCGAHMVDQGTVSRMFQRKGRILIGKDEADGEQLMELALETGAEDLKIAADQFEVITDPADFDAVSDAITQAGITVKESAVTIIPDKVSEVTDIDRARLLVKFIEGLKELDDVQGVYSNFDIPDEIAVQINTEADTSP